MPNPHEWLRALNRADEGLTEAVKRLGEVQARGEQLIEMERVYAKILEAQGDILSCRIAYCTTHQ